MMSDPKHSDVTFRSTISSSMNGWSRVPISLARFLAASTSACFPGDNAGEVSAVVPPKRIAKTVSVRK